MRYCFQFNKNEKEHLGIYGIKSVLGEKFIALNALEKGDLKVNNQCFYLKKREKEEQNKSKASRRHDLIKTETEIN